MWGKLRSVIQRELRSVIQLTTIREAGKFICLQRGTGAVKETLSPNHLRGIATVP